MPARACVCLRVSVCVYVSACVCLSVCLSFCLSACLSLCPSIWRSVCLRRSRERSARCVSVCVLTQSAPRASGTWRRARWTAHGGAAACMHVHVVSARLHLPPAKSDPIRRQDRARDNRAMRTVAKQPHLYMPLPTPSTNCSCPRLQEKDLYFRGMMFVKRLMCFSILFKKLHNAG